MSKVITVQDGNLVFNVSFSEGSADINVQDGNINLGADGNFAGTINLGTEVDVTPTGSIFLTEKAASDGNIATQGELWVRNDIPNVAMFTDDAGTDFVVAGSTASSALITVADTTDTTTNIVLVGDPTGDQAPLTDGGLIYDATAANLTATTFTGALSGNATTATALATGRTIGMTGDVAWTSASFDGSGNVTGTSTIQPDVVTYAKIQNVVADNVFLGNNAGAGAIVDELTGTEATALLDLFATAATTQGLVPGSNSAGATAYLDGTGTWSTPAGGGNVSNTGTPVNDQLAVWTDATTVEGVAALTFSGTTLTTTTFSGALSGNATTATALATGRTIGMTGDVAWTSASFDGSGNVTGTSTIQPDVVTMDMIVDIATDTFLGRVTAATGTVEVLTNAQAKTALDLTGTNSGDEPAATLSVPGIVELATIAETNTGTDATRAVTPDGLDGWTGSAQLTTGGVFAATTLTLADNAEIRFGTGNDSRIFFTTTDTFFDLTGAANDFNLRVNGTELALTAAPNGAVGLYWNGLHKFGTVDHTAADQISGAEIRDAEGNLRPAGIGVVISDTTTFNTVATQTPFQQVNATQNIYFVGAGAGTTNFDTYTNIEASQTNIPIGTMWYVQNNAATTILVIRGGASVTIRYWAGTGAPADADVTVARGGVATVRKVSDTIYDVWGIGLS